MNELLNELLTSVLTEAPKKPQASTAQKKSVVPAGLFPGSFGKYYRDKELTQYAGIVKAGKWVPASQDPDGQTKKATGKRDTTDKTTTSKQTKSTPKPATGKLTPKFDGGVGTLNAVTGVIDPGSAGAGTPESRAAEASVVLVANSLLSGRKSFKGTMDEYLLQNDSQIDSMISQLQSLEGSYLKEDWIKSVKAQVIATLSQTEKKYGKIESLVWDNAEGRASLDLPKVKDMNDRSDLYIRTDSGDVVGVSLKKSGKIFLANQGYTKIIATIEKFAEDEETKKTIRGLKQLHKSAVSKAFTSLFDYISANKSEVSSAISQFNRIGVKSLNSSKYNEFFTSDGKPTKQFLSKVVSGQRLSQNEFKALMKCLDGVKKQSPGIRKHIEAIRDVDIAATKSFLSTLEKNKTVREATTRYLLDALDIPQMMTKGGSQGIDHLVTVYGEGNVDEQGNPIPMYVNGTSIRETFGIGKNVNQEDALKELRTRFIIDAESDKRTGLIRMRITNKTPPPNYYYPTISTLALRARGIGSAAAFELYQHESWTYTLASKSPNPEDWTPQQRKKHAESTVKFLLHQSKNASLTKQERQQIAKDIEFYKNIK